MIAKLSPAMTEPENLAELVAELGNIPLRRIRRHPPIGTAQVQHLENTKCVELIEGTLVEKSMGMLLIATGLLIFTGTMPVIGGWLLEYLPALGRIG